MRANTVCNSFESQVDEDTANQSDRLGCIFLEKRDLQLCQIRIGITQKKATA